ncbi:SDR family NAD(P)-dependent oxidoreductase [Flavobacteriaceae bacterium]|nr:SDR family NAD(P)-dependent oxidoreductase [Flavobacteriaceae bacterium]MDB4642964.1 SDR family NAD(P)-dependent oxidoreductase [Flavobacteriaceae bacterium]
MNKTVLITGATSGIGKATAIFLASQGARLILCGRRKSRLNDLKKELPTEVHTLHFDVRDREAVFDSIAQIPEEFKPIDVLINNAGNAHGLDDVVGADLDDWDAMIDGNVKGLMYVTKAILPEMTTRKKGQIINLGSIAGIEVYPKGNAYCASKFAVDAFTQGLRIDLNSYGIRVGAIHPGLVETEFSEVRFKGDQEKAAAVYSQLDALQAEDVANTILFMINAPEHVTLADITILPTAQASATVINKNTLE